MQTQYHGDSSRWMLSNRAERRARLLADRHYNRQSIGATQFVPPGRCVVLLTKDADALWITSWPFAEYTKHDWAGAWICSCFRYESNYLSSSLITEAVAITRHIFGEPPLLGMVTFVDSTKVKPKQNPGYCYLMAGFKHVGYTKENNLVALQLLPDQMPEPQSPFSYQQSLF